MAYEKHEWQTGEVITADKLNHMEDGISPDFVINTRLLSDSSSVSMQPTGIEITSLRGISVEEAFSKADELNMLTSHLFGVLELSNGEISIVEHFFDTPSIGTVRSSNEAATGLPSVVGMVSERLGSSVIVRISLYTDSLKIVEINLVSSSDNTVISTVRYNYTYNSETKEYTLTKQE